VCSANNLCRDQSNELQLENNDAVSSDESVEFREVGTTSLDTATIFRVQPSFAEHSVTDSRQSVDDFNAKFQFQQTTSSGLSRTDGEVCRSNGDIYAADVVLTHTFPPHVQEVSSASAPVSLLHAFDDSSLSDNGVPAVHASSLLTDTTAASVPTGSKITASKPKKQRSRDATFEKQNLGIIESAHSVADRVRPKRSSSASRTEQTSYVVDKSATAGVDKTKPRLKTGVDRSHDRHKVAQGNITVTKKQFAGALLPPTKPKEKKPVISIKRVPGPGTAELESRESRSISSKPTNKAAALTNAPAVVEGKLLNAAQSTPSTKIIKIPVSPSPS
jgi:hypothetical protein